MRSFFRILPTLPARWQLGLGACLVFTLLVYLETSPTKLAGLVLWVCV